MTGLPFVYAMWVGRPGAATPEQCRALQQARDAGVAHLPEIARAVGGGNQEIERRSLIYLRDNLKYGLGEAEQAGLRRFHELATEIGVTSELKPLKFFTGEGR
jgi:chorismate dehydratase